MGITAGGRVRVDERRCKGIYILPPPKKKKSQVPRWAQFLPHRGAENAGHEIARHDKYLFIVVSTNRSNFSSIVETLM